MVAFFGLHVGRTNSCVAVCKVRSRFQLFSVGNGSLIVFEFESRMEHRMLWQTMLVTESPLPLSHSTQEKL